MNCYPFILELTYVSDFEIGFRSGIDFLCLLNGTLAVCSIISSEIDVSVACYIRIFLPTRCNLDDIKKVRSRVHSRVCSTVKVSVQANFWNKPWNKLWNELWNELWNILFYVCLLYTSPSPRDS